MVRCALLKERGKYSSGPFATPPCPARSIQPPCPLQASVKKVTLPSLRNKASTRVEVCLSCRVFMAAVPSWEGYSNLAGWPFSELFAERHPDVSELQTDRRNTLQNPRNDLSSVSIAGSLKSAKASAVRKIFFRRLGIITCPRWLTKPVWNAQFFEFLGYARVLEKSQKRLTVFYVLSSRYRQYDNVRQICKDILPLGWG